jgi:hypothetical protein
LDRFRFLPRYGGLAWSAAAIGIALLALTPILGLAGPSRLFALGTGIAGLSLATLYRLSPAWRLCVEVSEDTLKVTSGTKVRFELPWSEVERVVASPTTHTCFVDGGSPERSLLVPGQGASAPYDIEAKEQLFKIIIARVPAEKVHTVELLDKAPPS